MSLATIPRARPHRDHARPRVDRIRGVRRPDRPRRCRRRFPTPRRARCPSSCDAPPTLLAVAPPAYGESRPDGTWIEAPTNAFGNLINLAKGQREIVQAGTPILREIAEEVPVEDIDSAKIQELIAEMLAICRGRGVGLAAPQIGVPYRIFVLEDTVEGMSDVSPEDLRSQDRVPFPAKVVVNPVVTPATNLTAAFSRGASPCRATEDSSDDGSRCASRDTAATANPWISSLRGGRRASCSTRWIT